MEINNNAIVAFKAEVKEEVFGQEVPVAADSQVVMGAGEVVIQEVKLEAPSDVSGDEAPSEVGEEDCDPFDPSTNLLLEVEDDGRAVVGGDVGEDDSEEILVRLLVSSVPQFQLLFFSRILPACTDLAESATTSPLFLQLPWMRDLCPLWQCCLVGIFPPSSWTLVRRRRGMRMMMGLRMVRELWKMRMRTLGLRVRGKWWGLLGTMVWGM